MAEQILVVDDDPDIARFVEVNLRSAGYDVAVAGDGEEALEKAGDMRPDLVLLDVMMPRIDGFEVAQRLRKNPQTANTSIIMLTAKALSADKVTGLQAGADDYIIKPFDPIELLARVKGTLRRAKEMRNLSPLTGLPGNIRIQEEIERQVRDGRPFAVLYCDLDHFKTYNDQKGFVRGDRLIQSTAKLIQDAVVMTAARGSSATSAATTSSRSSTPSRPSGSPARSASGSMPCAASSTSPRISNAASSAWRTARVCCRTSRSSGSRSASPAARAGPSRTTARRWP
jgi:DNA-binding response OmpR family regulator